jgi:hypothetical protein
MCGNAITGVVDKAGEATGFNTISKKVWGGKTAGEGLNSGVDSFNEILTPSAPRVGSPKVTASRKPLAVGTSIGRTPLGTSKAGINTGV